MAGRPVTVPAGNPILDRVIDACRRYDGSLDLGGVRVSLGCAKNQVAQFATVAGFVEHLLEAVDRRTASLGDAAMIEALAPGQRLADRCRASTVADAADFYAAADPYYGRRGIIAGSPDYVLGADLVLPEEAIAQTAAAKLVPYLSEADLNDFAKGQRAAAARLAAAVTRGGACEIRPPHALLAAPAAADASCVTARVRQAISAEGAAELQRAVGGPPLPAADLEDLLAATAAFRTTETTYYEGKTYGKLPVAAFERVYARDREADHIAQRLLAAGCPLPVRAYNGYPTWLLDSDGEDERLEALRHLMAVAGAQAAIDEDRGIAVPARDQFAEVTLPSGERVLTGRYGYARTRPMIYHYAQTHPGTTVQIWEPNAYLAARGVAGLIPFDTSVYTGWPDYEIPGPETLRKNMNRAAWDLLRAPAATDLSPEQRDLLAVPEIAALAASRPGQPDHDRLATRLGARTDAWADGISYGPTLSADPTATAADEAAGLEAAKALGVVPRFDDSSFPGILVKSPKGHAYFRRAEPEEIIRASAENVATDTAEYLRQALGPSDA